MLSTVADGFTIHPGMIELPGRYDTMAIAQLELIRKSKTYRPYWLRLPENNEVIPAFGTYSYQAHLKPGTWLCGLQMFVESSLNETYEPPDIPTASQIWMSRAVLSIQITETSSGAQLFSEHSRTQLLYNQTLFGTSARLPFFLLSEPKVIVDPGDVDIDVCNLTGDSQTWQLLLLTAEPYEVVIP